MNTINLRFVEEDESSVQERKASMRSYMKARRGENENRDIKASLLLQHFKTLFFGDWMGAGMRRNYFVYLSYSSEAPTDELILFLLEQGQRVFCPRVEGQALLAVEFGDDFTLSDIGIREPVGEAYTGEIDVIIFPLLAVDKKGNRLGYGGGFTIDLQANTQTQNGLRLRTIFKLWKTYRMKRGTSRCKPSSQT
ncbi:MAG: hypothetical protein J6D30_01070 [Clostridia bacterium]|nr:hypothetical protein [Clostridia bacterium]